jgi:putative DNA primase/helicase
MNTDINDFNSAQREDEERPELVDYVRAFVHQQYDGHLVYANEQFYTYREGFWPQLNERTDVRKPIAEYLGKHAKPQRINAYVSLMQDLYAERSLAEPGSEICVANGTLNPETGELRPHSPVPRLRSKLDIVWDPKAECPQVREFLETIFSPDDDKAQKISFLEEFAGYCLTADTSMHKFAWLAGSGGNGKSVFLELLTNLVGPSNVSHAHVDRFEDEAVRAELEGKLLNVSFEMTSDATISGGQLKAIVSGDRIEARRLYQPSFSFKPYVKVICATNELPRLNDLSGGFARRAVILRFNRVFGEGEQDKGLLGKLLREKAGLLVLAIEGLKRLRKQGQFTIPASSVTELAQYRTEADSVAQYVEEKLQPTDGGGMEPSVPYRQYQEWCRECGFTAVNKLNFGKRLARLGMRKRKSNGKELWLMSWRSFTPAPMSEPPCAVSTASNIRKLQP